MNNILAVLVFLIAISCQFKKTKENIENELLNKMEQLQLEPEEFISSLPSKLAENSGMIIYDDLIWTFNDSGGKNKIYGFNFKGEIKKEVEIEDADNRDWEDIAQDKKHIYIGDFGNNSGMRDNQVIYKINKKDINKKKTQNVDSKKIEFQFANQSNFKLQRQSSPFDCEAMTVFNDSIYIFTKDWSDRTTTLYKMPTKKGEYKISPYKKLNVDALITGADISPDKKRLALIGYRNYKPVLWLFSDFESDHFFDGNRIRMQMDNLQQAQTEGTCFWGNDSLLVSCERSARFEQQVFLIDLSSLE